MTGLNTAQQLLVAIGMDPMTLILAHSRGKQFSHTKTGPGRKHAQGKRKD